MDDHTNPPSVPSRLHVPRKPERAQGKRRYAQLLDAADRLLLQDGLDGVTIQRVAQEAAVPKASVYHFFPSPASLSVGLSERYLADLARHIGDDIHAVDSLPWQAVVGLLMDRAVAYYMAHPNAQRLILGSDHSWQIRKADHVNNRLLAASLADLFATKFPNAAPHALQKAIIVSIGIGDAILTLSIFEHGRVLPEFGREATVAICAYMSARFGTAPGMPLS